MNVNENAIEELIKLKIKEHFKKENKFYKLSKEDLIDFCIKLVKVIEGYN